MSKNVGKQSENMELGYRVTCSVSLTILIIFTNTVLKTRWLLSMSSVHTKWNRFDILNCTLIQPVALLKLCQTLLWPIIYILRLVLNYVLTRSVPNKKCCKIHDSNTAIFF